jgi:hypothetical protein
LLSETKGETMLWKDYPLLLKRTPARRLAIPDRLIVDWVVEKNEFFRLLQAQTCKLMATNIAELARFSVQRQPPIRYVCGVDAAAAPDVVDCSTFVGYLYQQAGISLPRYSIDQYQHGLRVEREALAPMDLVFRTSFHNYERHGIMVGHVGMVVRSASHGQETEVVHAVPEGLELVSLTDFVGKHRYRGARRIIFGDYHTVELPETKAMDQITTTERLLRHLESLVDSYVDA